MLKTLLSLECKKILGLNEFLYSKNQKNIRRHSSMNLAASIMLAVIFSLLITGQVYGLIMLGAEKIIPSILIQAGSLIILLTSFSGTGQSLFSPRGLSTLRALPIRIEAIALSRLLGRYIESLILSVVLLLPGTIMLGILARQHLFYYFSMILGIICLPLLPLAVSALLGTGIMAISSKSRHPAGIQTLLSLLLMILLMGSMIMNGKLPDLSQSPEIFTAQLAELLPEKLSYPPANWLGKAALTGNIPGLAGYLGLSLGSFISAAALLCLNFDRICRKLFQSRNSRAFLLTSLEDRSPLKALYTKERRRYFSSSIYVSNTIIGPILAFISAAALNFADLEAAEKFLPVSISTLLPLAWSMICCMMPACAVSISMEGKQIWQVQSLPIPIKTLLDSKLLWNLTLMLPSYLLSQIAMTVAVKPKLADFLWQLAMPLAMMAFSCIFALSADLHFHNFNFEKEETAVKQSLSALVGGFGGVLMGLIAGGTLILFKGENSARWVIFAAVTAAAGICYQKNCRKKAENL